MEYEYKVLSETDFDSSWNFHVGFSITTRHVAGVPGCWRAVAKFGGGCAFFLARLPLEYQRASWQLSYRLHASWLQNLPRVTTKKKPPDPVVEQQL